MRFLRSLAFAVAFLAPVTAFAQYDVQINPSRLDAAVAVAGPAGGVTSCNTVNTSIVNNTVTITPGSNQRVYVWSVGIDIASDATGTTGVATASWTGFASNPVYSLATVAVATAAGSQNRQIYEEYPTALVSQQPGVAVVLTPSAQIAHEIYCPRVAYSLAP